MARLPGQDPLQLKYDRLTTLEAGYNIDRMKRGGAVMVSNPTNSGTALAAGTYIVETMTGVLDGRQVTFQVASSVGNGNEFVRHGDGNVWANFDQRGTGGGGGSGDAIDVTYDDATRPTPLVSTNVQAVLEELIRQVFPGGVASRTFNVLDYGADRTGVANSRTAFENAVLAADAVGGGVVYVPTGTYSIGAGGSPSLGGVLLRDKIMLMGDGPGRSIIRCADLGNNDMSGLVRTQSGQENDFIVVRGLTLDGNKAAQTGWANTVPFFCGVTPGNRVLKDTDVWVIDVEAKNGRNGTAGSGHDGNGGYGFDPHEIAERIHFINCLAHDNEEDGFVLDGCTNIDIIGCKSWANGRHGFNFVTQSEHGKVIGCSAWDNAANNMTIQQDSQDIIVQGNIFRNSGESGIRLRRGATITNTRCLITDNIVVGSGRNGIQVTGASQNVISDNMFIDNGQTTNNTYFDVALDEDDGDSGPTVGAANNIIKNNYAIATATNKTKAGYRENLAAVNPPNNNTYYWNYASGQVLSKYDDISTTSQIIDHGYVVTYEAAAHGVSPANADNRVALRNLVTLVSNRGGGEILLPAGTLNASGTGTASQGIVSLPAKVSLRGQGKNVTILNCIDPVNNDVTGVVRTLSGGTNKGTVVSDLTITAANPSGTGGVTLMTVAGASDEDFLAINVEFLTAREAGSGFYGSRVTSSSTNARFIHCTSNGSERDGFYEQGVRTQYLGCYAANSVRHGFYAQGATEPQYIGCRGFNNGSHQILIDNVFAAKVIGCDFDANLINADCARIKGGATVDMHTLMVGNTFRNSGRDGLSIAGSNFNRVTSNTFINNGQQTNNTYHDVAIELDTAVTSNHNVISDNIMLSAAANKTATAVNEVATCNNNNVVMNKFSGQVGGPVTLTGAGSVRFDTGFFQIRDTAFTLMDDADLTKLARFELSTIATGTTRTITLPNKSGTLAMLDDVSGFSGSLVQGNEDAAPTPATAPAVSLVGVPKGPMTLVGTIDPSSRFVPFQQHIAAGQEGSIHPRNNSTTVDTVGTGLTASGTATARAVASGAGLLGSTRRIGYVSTAAANNSAGARWGSAWLWRGNATDLGGFWVCVIAACVGAPVTPRVFMGLAPTSASIFGASENTDPSAAVNIFGIGKDAADSNLQLMHNDNAGTATKVNLGANFPWSDGVMYETWLRCSPNGSAIEYNVRRLDSFFRNSGTISTDLISSGTMVGLHAVSNSGSTAEAANIDVIQLWGKSVLAQDQP